MIDPTTALIEASNAERDRLRAENDRLSKALVTAYTDVQVLKAERDRMFVEGYDQAVCEIRDHFRRKADAEIVAKEIEKIWLQDKLS